MHFQDWPGWLKIVAAIGGAGTILMRLRNTKNGGLWDS